MTKYHCADCKKVGTEPGDLIETEWCWLCPRCAAEHGIIEEPTAYTGSEGA